MASSKGTSNGPDWQDITQALLNYEHFNQCQIGVTIRALGTPATADLEVEAAAYRKDATSQEAKLLASVKLNVKRQLYRHLESVIMKVLYDLDVAFWQEQGLL